MKLSDLHEQEDAFGNWLKSKMMRRIKKGSSRLKDALTGDYTLEHVRYAIEKSICFKNLGPTYLEQTISNLLRDMVQNNELLISQMNDARNYFNLDKMTPAELTQEKKKTQA